MTSATISAQTGTTRAPTKEDPYQYALGFGNRFETEALPGVLPYGQIHPQKVKYGLYHEGMTGSPFTATRFQNTNAMFYRLRPSVAHQGFTDLPDNPDVESSFLPLNPRVKVSPTQLAWRPLDIPTEPTDFIGGLKTIAGAGDPTLREGLAIHMYLANTSMGKKAFCNNDGDMLMMPQQGRLDIQTEFGKLMVKPGELVVIQRGMKYKVLLPDGPSRGYVQELFGAHYELPDLGPLGGHGLANARDFEVPLACFDIDQSPWEIVYKIGGKFFSCSQGHTPFDVVAWHGNYVPYKYDMSKFIFVGSISRDHIDPSCFCMLTARSKASGIPLTDVLIFGERWDVAEKTFRPPYFHRNSSTEFLGLIMGNYGGRADAFLPGSMSHETVFCPHGVSNEVRQQAIKGDLKPEKIHTGTMMVMFESSMIFTLTDYALNKTGKLHEHDPKMWDGLAADFMQHLDEVNADLVASGREALSL